MARGQPWVTSYPGVPPQPPQSCPRPGLSLTYLPPSPRAATSWAQQVWDGRQLGGKKGKMSSYWAWEGAGQSPTSWGRARIGAPPGCPATPAAQTAHRYPLPRGASWVF